MLFLMYCMFERLDEHTTCSHTGLDASPKDADFVKTYKNKISDVLNQLNLDHACTVFAIS
jgi:hypothetical protein